MELSSETTLGFTNKMTNLQKSKVEKVLNKPFNINGKVLSEKELIVKFILEGYTVLMKENYSYQKRNGELSKPKNVYRIYTGEKTFLEITKTAYEFALYLFENNFTNNIRIKEYIENENTKKSILNNEPVTQKEINEEPERDKNEKSNKWNGITEKLLSENQTKDIKSIIINTVKTFVPHETNERIEIFAENSDFIQFLGNQSGVKNRVKYLFNNDNMDYLETNLPLTIEYNIYKYVFNISELNTQRDINKKVSSFYRKEISKLS